MLTLRREALRPLAASSHCDFHFSRGVALTYSADRGVVVGGADSRHHLPKPERERSYAGEVETTMAEHVQEALTVELLGISNPRLRSEREALTIAPPTRLVFRTEIGLWDHESLAEELLARLQLVEHAARVLTWRNRDGAADPEADTLVQAVQSQIRNGHVGLAEFTAAVSDATARNVRLYEALHIANGVSLSEDVRGALLRACHHAVAMIRAVRRVNESQDVRLVVTQPRQPVLEMEHFSADIDAAAAYPPEHGRLDVSSVAQ